MLLPLAIVIATISQHQTPASALQPTALAVPPVSAAASIDPIKVAWLRGHEFGGGPVKGPLHLDLPADILKARLVLLGESHGAAAPQVVDLALLTELNHRIGLRDYLAEVDPVQALTLNRYLVTGEAALLTRVFAVWKGTAQWGNTAFMDKVRGVRALNQTLPAGRRIHFIGIDRVQDWPLVFDWLKRSGAAADDASIEAAKSDAEKAALALAALPLATAAPRAVRERLAAALGRKDDTRETTIFNNYAFAVRSGELGDRQAYGLWGLFHVMQGGINGASPFALKVKSSDLPAARNLRSIIVLALDSAVLIPGGARLSTTNIDGPLVNVPGAANLRAASRADSTVLWTLDAPGSPYRTAPDLVAVQTKLGQNFNPDDPALPATAYAQYAGVFRNSDWAPPIR